MIIIAIEVSKKYNYIILFTMYISFKYVISNLRRIWKILNPEDLNTISILSIILFIKMMEKINISFSIKI